MKSAAIPLLVALAFASPSAAAPRKGSVVGSGSSTTATAFAVNVTSGPFGPVGPLTSGDLAVTDSPPPPSTTRQCLGGGSEAYGFANRGRCIAYVRAGRLAAGHARG